MSWMDMLNDMSEEEAMATDFQPVPDGWYEVVSSGTREKPNKSNAGHHVEVTFTVIGESYNGRKVFANYNVDNPNTTAQKIGLGELKRFAAAAGVERMSDLADLDDHTLWIKVGRDKGQPDRNAVKAYRATAPDADTDEPKPIAKPEAKVEEPKAARKPWSKK